MASGENFTPLYINTPLIESTPLSQLAGCQVYLKLENTQPTHTFKLRGISHLIQKKKSSGCTRVISSSGGNAGLAAAYSARKLAMPCTIIVPSTTPQFAIDRLKGEGAEVEVHGSVWDEANKYAEQLASARDGTAMVHPFDHPDIWEGHGSMMVETATTLNTKPDLVILSVGGGGLMCGVLRGMDTVGWGDIPLLAMETHGADCFNAAIKAGKLVTLPAITSVAKHLGALTVCQEAMNYYNSGRPLISEVVTDHTAVLACDRFADDHKMLVEPACGAALAALYNNVINKLVKEGTLQQPKTIVVIVCGGFAVNIPQMNAWKKAVGIDNGQA